MIALGGDDTFGEIVVGGDELVEMVDDGGNTVVLAGGDILVEMVDGGGNAVEPKAKASDVAFCDGGRNSGQGWSARSDGGRYKS